MRRHTYSLMIDSAAMSQFEIDRETTVTEFRYALSDALHHQSHMCRDPYIVELLQNVASSIRW